MRQTENAGEIALEKEEVEMLLRHLEQFESLVKEFESRDSEKRLADGWSETWKSLRAFLEGEELPGSEIPRALAADGRYCCQWRTRGLASGERDCHQYNAWYIFAWSACVAAAIWRNADATLQAGECADMPGCPR
jgi:hypothetical protein